MSPPVVTTTIPDQEVDDPVVDFLVVQPLQAQLALQRSDPVTDKVPEARFFAVALLGIYLFRGKT